MIKLSKMLGGAAVLLLMLSAVPAKAQLAGFDGMGSRGGGDDMMTQMAPMMDMMKSQMGKRKFRKMMKGAGPMMGKMMGNGGPSGMNGMSGEMPGGFGGGLPGGMGGFGQ